MSKTAVYSDLIGKPVKGNQEVRFWWVYNYRICKDD